MSEFQWLRLRRATIFDPPTLLDKFLLSPLRALIQHVYAILLILRGAPFKPPQNKPSIRIVCISDTHTHTPQVPNGDVLIHAGDLTNAGTIKDIQAQFDWINSLPHKHKIVIAGNHDSYFDPNSRMSVDKKSGAKLNYHDIHYLQNQSLRLKFEGNRTLNFFGSPDIPRCGGSDFALVISIPCQITKAHRNFKLTTQLPIRAPSRSMGPTHTNLN
jgi:Calcineurin-like phosphoesterase